MVEVSAAEGFLRYVNASPSPFHAVLEAVTRLEAAGFTRLREGDDWGELKPGALHYVTRNESSIIAFSIGGKWRKGGGLNIVGAHTDSPCLKVKPTTKKPTSAGGSLQVGVQTYGGGLWHTWFDRDLGASGRVVVRETSADGTVSFKTELVRIDEPIMRVPTIAIHLNRTVNSEGFKINGAVRNAVVVIISRVDGVNPAHPCMSCVCG